MITNVSVLASRSSSAGKSSSTMYSVDDDGLSVGTAVGRAVGDAVVTVDVVVGVVAVVSVVVVVVTVAVVVVTVAVVEVTVAVVAVVVVGSVGVEVGTVDGAADEGAGVATGMPNSAMSTSLLAYASLPSATMYTSTRYVMVVSRGKCSLPMPIVTSNWP